MKAKTTEIKSDIIHSILSEIDYEFDRNGGEIPRFITDFLFEVDELQSVLEEYNVTPENIREVLLTGQMFRNQPTLSECIKEWEDRGWTYRRSKYYNWFFVEKEYKEISFDCDKINYECESFFEIDLELNILITKTLKALEVENEK